MSSLDSANAKKKLYKIASQQQDYSTVKFC